MTFAALAGMAGTALVQAMRTDEWEDVRQQVAQMFAHDEPNPLIGLTLDNTRQRLTAASPSESKQAQAELAAQWQTLFENLLADRPDAGTEVIALVEEALEDLKPVTASTGTTAQAIAGSVWQTVMQNFIVGRYDRVQAAAQTWLTIMTTLFGVFSTVVVVSGARTISEIHGGLPWRIGVVAGAAAVYLLAFVATMYGLFASWGGLGAGLQHEPKKPVWRELKDMWWPKDLTLAEIKYPDWHNYRGKYTLDRANQNRKRLHRSRVLGVTAVAFAGLLGFALIANGFID
jgi:hypothetical protein